jgi:small conductance mechanosensitive channel
LVVPNNNIWGTTIINVTGSMTRRVDLVFGIGYGDDMAKAEKIMLEVVSKHALVLENPAPVIKVNELADSSVNFVCRPWVKTENYLDVYWDITRQVKEEFDKQGVSIPFPQRDVHVHQVAE